MNDKNTIKYMSLSEPRSDYHHLLSLVNKKARDYKNLIYPYRLILHKNPKNPIKNSKL